jgi:hypothetical protein
MSIVSKCSWLGALAALPLLASAAEEPSNQPQGFGIPYRSDSAQADALFSNDASKMTVEHRADGSTVIWMNGEGMQAVTAARGDDGVVRYQCEGGKLEHVLQHGAEHLDEK